MRNLIAVVLLFIPLLSSSQTKAVDVSTYGNIAAFAIVLDTFQAPVGLGGELGMQVNTNGLIAFGNIRRGVIGTRANKNRYNMIQFGLGGTHNVFFFTASVDYTNLNIKDRERTNIGAIGAGLRVGFDIPIMGNVGLFGVANLGTNRLHTYFYAGLGVSYHIPLKPKGPNNVRSFF